MDLKEQFKEIDEAEKKRLTEKFFGTPEERRRNKLIWDCEHRRYEKWFFGCAHPDREKGSSCLGERCPIIVNLIANLEDASTKSHQR